MKDWCIGTYTLSLLHSQMVFIVFVLLSSQPVPDAEEEKDETDESSVVLSRCKFCSSYHVCFFMQTKFVELCGPRQTILVAQI